MHRVGIIALILVAALGALPARVQASQFTVVAQVSPASVPNGGTATLTVHTRIGANCVVSILYDDGSAAPGLPGQHVGQSGIVKWQWAVHTSASGGTAASACTSKGLDAIGQARFSVGAPAVAVKGKVVLSLSGGGHGSTKIDSTTFNVTGTFIITYQAHSTLPSTSLHVGLLSITVLGGGTFDSAATEYPSAGETPTGTALERHVNCSKGCYLTITSKDVKWAVTVQPQ